MAETMVKKSTELVAMPTANITYKTSSGDLVELNSEAIRKLTNDNKFITEGEIMLFIEMCKYQKLNPYTKEAYLVKYDERKPASQVVSLGAFMRVADENPTYEGIEDGVIIKTAKGDIVDREGCVIYPGEFLIGGWAKVYRSNRKVPAKARLSLKEYSKGQATWTASPAMMINKCAKVAALRKAFPSAFSGCYIEDELKNTDAAQEPTNVDDVVFYDIPSDDGAIEQIVTDEVVAESGESETAQTEAPTNLTGAERGTVRISYAQYNANKEKYEKVPNSYDKDTKTIEVYEGEAIGD